MHLTPRRKSAFLEKFSRKCFFFKNKGYSRLGIKYPNYYIVLHACTHVTTCRNIYACSANNMSKPISKSSERNKTNRQNKIIKYL